MCLPLAYVYSQLHTVCLHVTHSLAQLVAQRACDEMDTFLSNAASYLQLSSAQSSQYHAVSHHLPATSEQPCDEMDAFLADAAVCVQLSSIHPRPHGLAQSATLAASVCSFEQFSTHKQPQLGSLVSPLTVDPRLIK